VYHGFVGNTLPPRMKVPFCGASIVLERAYVLEEWQENATAQSYDGMRKHKLKTGTSWPLWTELNKT
jgi:hypothetical protein